MASNVASIHAPEADGRTPFEDDPGFVVPDPDGVQSGVPFERAANNGEAFKPAGGRASGLGAHRQHDAAAHHLSLHRGMSLKRKLNLSLGLLTLIIAVLGAVAINALRQVNAISFEVAEHHAPLARTVEGIKEGVYLIHDAEKDFLLLEDEALDRVSRHTAKVREHLERATALAASIEASTGRPVGAHFAEMGAALDQYEARFADQIQDVKQARSVIAEEAAANRANREKLADHISDQIEVARRLALDYWLAMADGADGRSVETGLALQGIEKDLLELRVQVADFFGTGHQSLAEAARTGVARTLDQIDAVRADVPDERVRQGMEELGRALQGFGALLRDSASTMAESAAHKRELDERIDEQKDELRRIGASIIDLAKEVAAGSWQAVADENRLLVDTGSSAKTTLAIAVAAGVLLGLFVLVTVPRPIMASISGLLKGARQVAEGDLSTPIRVTSSDELGQLAANFDHMRENLLALVQRIQRASVQLSSSINEIQAASTQQASSSAEQASAVNQLSASLSEMSQSAATLVSSSETVGRNVDDIVRTVNDNNAQSTRMLASMDAIGLSTRQTAERIKALNDKMNDINEAVGTISLVADQTTLLSLNASIEANKAGEMGKGFSVVANEIRRLSDRSIDSATGINGMVRDIQRATESSAVAMDKSGEEIRQGIDLVKATTQSLNTIDESMDHIQEQVKMILESVRAQAESSRMVQSTATELLASANMVAKAAGQTQTVTYELNAMATQLSAAVAAFKL